MTIAADCQRGEDPRHDRETPAGGNHDPTGFFSLGLAQYDIRHDAVAKQHHDHRAEKFAEKWRMHTVPFAIFLETIAQNFVSSITRSNQESGARTVARCQTAPRGDFPPFAESNS